MNRLIPISVEINQTNSFLFDSTYTFIMYDISLKTIQLVMGTHSGSLMELRALDPHF